MLCRQVNNVSSSLSFVPARIIFLLLFNYHMILSNFTNNIFFLFADNFESKNLISMTIISRFQKFLKARIYNLTLTYSCRDEKFLMIWAIINKREIIFRSLVEREIVLSIQNDNENTILHHLIDKSSTYLVCLLLEKHIDVSVQNKKNCLKTLNLKGTNVIFT